MVASYDSMQEGTDASVLPQNFRNAVEISRRLGMQHLWIDSLCIIQDSDEDWQEQSRGRETSIRTRKSTSRQHDLLMGKDCFSTIRSLERFHVESRQHGRMRRTRRTERISSPVAPTGIPPFRDLHYFHELGLPRSLSLLVGFSILLKGRCFGNVIKDKPTKCFQKGFPISQDGNLLPMPNAFMACLTCTMRSSTPL
jgi:hypothetical protein